MKVALEINSCKECPHFTTANHWSSDGWDRMEDWVCLKHPENSMRKFNGSKEIVSNTEPGKLIQGVIEWHEKVLIPYWCPIKI